MKLSIYALHDSKAEAYTQPFYAINDSVAMRNVSSSINQPGNDVHLYPSDFTLYRIGEFDDTNAHIIPSDLVRLCNCSELINTKIEL